MMISNQFFFFIKMTGRVFLIARIPLNYLSKINNSAKLSVHQEVLQILRLTKIW